MFIQWLIREIERVYGDDVFCITLKDGLGREIEILAEKDKIRNILKVWVRDDYHEIPDFEWDKEGVFKLLKILRIHGLV